MENENKNRENETFFTKAVQNPPKSGENSHESSNNSTFDELLVMFHGLKINPKLLQNYNYKEIMITLCTLWAKKGDFEITRVINPDFSIKTVPD